MLHVLDTDIASESVHGNVAIRARVAALSQEEVCVTIVTAQEMVAGWLPQLTRQQPADRYVWAYAGLRRALHFLRDITILDFDDAAAREYTRLRATYRRLGTMDLRIAAIALVNNAVVVTRNVSHFGQIEGLGVEDWSA